ncbi:MAG TPA: zf-HC2 domain-containing protein [Longimicrobiaceae bacterium]|nr:zf-HC2 domain-containing protein [Longimicrobiaceae bacterium]
MMPHAAEGTLQALLDGELSRAEGAEVERHLETCPACRAEAERLRAASDGLTAALALLDRPAATGRALDQLGRRRWRRWVGVDSGQVLRRAAVLVLGVASLASATPGSPVREWIGELLHGAGAESAPGGLAAVAPVSTPDAPPAGEASAAVSVLPDLGRVRVVVTAPSPDLRIRVRLSDDSYSDVRATGAAAGARFRTGPGRVEVSGAGPGEVEVVLPRSARSATVEVDGRPYFRRDGEGIRLLAPASDSSGSEIVFTVRP